jgi:hypothetical protein
MLPCGLARLQCCRELYARGRHTATGQHRTSINEEDVLTIFRIPYGVGANGSMARLRGASAQFKDSSLKSRAEQSGVAN